MSAPGMRIEVDQNDLARVTRKLHGVEKDARKAIRNAANDAAVRGRRLLADHARARYTVKLGDFNRHMHITRATTATLTAIITSNGRTMMLTNFHHTMSKKYGAKAEVLKGSGLKALEMGGIKSFTGTASGNKGILQRLSAARYPLRVHHGPSAPKMIEMVWKGGKITDEGIKEKVREYYQKRLESNIQRMLAS